MTTALKKLDRAEIELDAKTTARVVESLVIRGDISALSPEERSRFYVQMCDSLGLNSAAHPFAILRLNGKEILYPTRGATDQLAAIHRLNREIIDGPKVIDVAGTKLVYAVCRTTHPNGRIETATSMVPLPTGAENICNAFLKCETKARRRGTLSILGLALLDETEIETIPASAKSPGTPIDVHVEPARPASAPQVILDDISSAATVGGDGRMEITLDAAAAIYCDRHDLGPEDRAAGYTALLRACPTGTLSAELQRAIAGEEVRRERKARTSVDGTEPLNAPPLPPALQEFDEALDHIELPGEAVALWIKNRAELARLAPQDQHYAWKAICLRVEEIGKMKNAKVWLKRAIAEEDARAGRDEPEPPKGGRRAKPANDAATADPERDAIQSEGGSGAQAKLLAAIGRLRDCESSKHLVPHYGVHVHELPAAVRAAYRDFAVTFLAGRYPRVAPTRDVAAAMLDQAAAERVAA